MGSYAPTGSKFMAFDATVDGTSYYTPIGGEGGRTPMAVPITSGDATYTLSNRRITKAGFFPNSYAFAAGDLFYVMSSAKIPRGTYSISSHPTTGAVVLSADTRLPTVPIAGSTTLGADDVNGFVIPVGSAVLPPGSAAIYGLLVTKLDTLAQTITFRRCDDLTALTTVFIPASGGTFVAPAYVPVGGPDGISAPFGFCVNVVGTVSGTFDATALAFTTYFNKEN